MAPARTRSVSRVPHFSRPLREVGLCGAFLHRSRAERLRVLCKLQIFSSPVCARCEASASAGVFSAEGFSAAKRRNNAAPGAQALGRSEERNQRRRGEEEGPLINLMVQRRCPQIARNCNRRQRRHRFPQQSISQSNPTFKGGIPSFRFRRYGGDRRFSANFGVHKFT